MTRGSICGPIWAPYGAQCWTPFRYDLTREDDRIRGDDRRASLRDHALHLLADRGGDFVAASIGDAVLISTATFRRGGRAYKRERVWDLGAFASVADLYDREFLPDLGEGE
jgi:hypothetical protein